MKKITLITAAIFAYCLMQTANCFPQGTAINNSGASADSSAILDVSSTSKGMLVPRMLKADKLSISNPANGLLIYQTNDTTGFWYYNGVKWVQAVGPAGVTGATGITGATGGTGTGGGESLLFPDGLTGMTPVMLNNLGTSPYTVPAGKNLYITNLWSGSLSMVLQATVGGTNYQLWNGLANRGDIGSRGAQTPFILPEGAVIRTPGTYPDYPVINGFLVDATVTPVVLSNLYSNPYTVPAGKTLVITNYCTTVTSSAYALSINNIAVWSGASNYYQSVGSPQYNYWNNGTFLPFIASSGIVVKNCQIGGSTSFCIAGAADNTAVLNGYLK